MFRQSRCERKLSATTTELLLSLTHIIAFIDGRLKVLTPGVNVKLKEYNKLREERAALTELYFDAMLKAKGYDFTNDIPALFPISTPTLLRFGDAYGTLIRVQFV